MVVATPATLAPSLVSVADKVPTAPRSMTTSSSATVAALAGAAAAQTATAIPASRDRRLRNLSIVRRYGLLPPKSTFGTCCALSGTSKYFSGPNPMKRAYSACGSRFTYVLYSCTVSL